MIADAISARVSVPDLSLCVPTYNRAALLAQGLRAIFDQIDPEEAVRLEVLVLDNASPDNTPAVIEQARQRSPHVPLRVVRHSENTGMDGNFMAAITEARGRFVYLVSDDDVLLPGAVTKLLYLIREHPDFDGFCLNARTFFHNPEEETPAWFPLAEDVTIWNKDEALELLETSVGFLSSLAFNKSRIAERLEAGYYRDKIGTSFVQVFMFLDVLASNKGFIVLAQPLLAQRADNSPLDNYFRVFVTGINAVMTYAEQVGYSQKGICRIKSKNLVYARHFVSRVKIYGHGAELWPSRRDAIQRLFRMYGFNPYLWLVVVPLMFFPRPLKPFVLWLRRLLGRPEPMWGATGRG